MESPPPHLLHEDDLVIAAWDANALTAEARQHLAECPTCSERAVSYRRLGKQLTTQLYRWDCPTTQEISDFAAGALKGKRRRALASHFRRCPRCSEELQVSLEFLAPAASPSLAPLPLPLPETTRPRLIARLLPQRAPGAGLAGVRGGETGDGWPRQYEVEGISLSLHRAAPAAGSSGAMLLGLISRAEAAPDVFEGVEVRLRAAGVLDEPALIVEQIDDLGNFMLSPVPTGQFDLLIALPQGDLVIEGLELSG